MRREEGKVAVAVLLHFLEAVLHKLRGALISRAHVVVFGAFPEKQGVTLHGDDIVVHAAVGARIDTEVGAANFVNAFRLANREGFLAATWFQAGKKANSSL